MGSPDLPEFLISKIGDVSSRPEHYRRDIAAIQERLWLISKENVELAVARFRG